MTKRKCLLHLLASLWMPVLLCCAACTPDGADDLPVPEGERQEGFLWTRAEDLPSRQSFLRNLGVGFSYDAVRGEYCNWNDIRCQIVNRSRMDWQQGVLGMTLWSSIQTSAVNSTSLFTYNQHDYVAAIRLDTQTEIDLGLYNSEKRTRQDVLEDGLSEQFYYSLDETVLLGHQAIHDADIIALVEMGQEDLYTLSFRHAVEHLEDMDCNAFSVDSFLQVYGTHVITAASLGGRLRIDLTNDMLRYSDKASDSLWTSEQILWAYEHREETRQSEEYAWIESSSMVISAYGGDQSLLTGILGRADFEGRRTFSMEPVNRWRESLRYHPDREDESNVEMTDMSVRPIWDFIEPLSPEVARHVRAAVLQEVNTQQALLGGRYFFSAAFPTSYAQASCRYAADGGWHTLTASDKDAPLCVNVVQDGRYVASVCHEQIEGRWYWVAYPIFSGRLKQASGLAVRDDGKAFSVRHVNGVCNLTQLPADKAPQTRTFYINQGELSLVRSDAITYSPCQVMLYAELDRGVRPDGSVSGKPYAVTRQDGLFLLPGCRDSLCAVAGWEWTPGGWQRVSDYHYIYNPSEMRPAENNE